MGITKCKVDYMMEYPEEIVMLRGGLSLRKVRSRTGSAINTLRKIRRMFPLGLNTLLNACRLITLGIVSQPNPSEQLIGILFFMIVLYNNSKTITLYTMFLS